MGEVIKKGQEQEPNKQHCSPSDTSPTYSTPKQRSGLPSPGEYLMLHPLQCNRCAQTKKYGPNERTDQNSEKELSDDDIANLSDAEFKTLIIRILTEIIVYIYKIKEKLKAMQK